MKRNMGSTDQIVRIVIALVLAGLYFGNVITGVLGIIALIVAGIFVLTGFVSFCPIYAALGWKTTKKV